MDTQTKVNRQGLGAAGRGKAKEQVFLVLPLPSVLRGAGPHSCDTGRGGGGVNSVKPLAQGPSFT